MRIDFARRGCEGEIKSSGMNGLHLDDIIRTVRQLAQKEIRINRAGRWPTVQGKVLSHKIVADGLSGYRASIDYSYHLNHETYYGGAQGLSQDRKTAESLADKVVVNAPLTIRYDPADPIRSMLLNRDNAELPFPIDE
jgi:uncharacterized protein DUF3592